MSIGRPFRAAFASTAIAAGLMARGCGAPPAPMAAKVPSVALASSNPSLSSNAAPVVSSVAASSSSSAPATCAPIQTELPELITTDIDVPVPAIEDPTGQVMALLHDKLARLLRAKRPITFASACTATQT